MIYCEIDNDDRVVQAMRLPSMTAIADRTNLDFWICSLKGRREFRYVGDEVRFAATRWSPGDWIVAEVDHSTGDMVFKCYTNPAFENEFARVA